MSKQVTAQCIIMGGLYHLPRPSYPTDCLLSALEETLDEITSLPDCPAAIIAGDSLRRMGLNPEFEGPTHEGHSLDRVYATESLYRKAKTFKSTVRTKHMAVVMTSDHNTIFRNTSKSNDRTTHDLRLRTPSSLNMMQDYLSKQDWSFIYNCKSIEISFSSFYVFMKAALDLFFPIKRITIKSRDPPYMTPYLKHLLRRKNHLHRHGRLAAAEALATRINHLIARNNEATFDCLARGSRRLWSKVRRLRCGARECPVLDRKITADSLNLHYSKTDTAS